MAGRGEGRAGAAAAGAALPPSSRRAGGAAPGRAWLRGRRGRAAPSATSHAGTSQVPPGPGRAGPGQGGSGALTPLCALLQTWRGGRARTSACCSTPTGEWRRGRGLPGAAAPGLALRPERAAVAAAAGTWIGVAWDSAPGEPALSGKVGGWENDKSASSSFNYCSNEKQRGLASSPSHPRTAQQCPWCCPRSFAPSPAERAPYTVPRGVYGKTGRGARCHALVATVVVGHRLDSMSEVFSNLIDSVIVSSRRATFQKAFP